VCVCVCDISSLRVNGPSEPGRLRDVCVCQWVKTAVFFCLYTYVRFITAERILMKFDIGLLYENLSSHFTFRLDWTVLKPTQQETDRNFCTHFAHLLQECQNSKLGIFELLV